MKTLAQTFEEMELDQKRKRLIENLKIAKEGLDEIRSAHIECADRIEMQKDIITKEIIRLLESSNA